MTIKQKGVGLIEVLVSTVVIALGLLAVASMQGNFFSSSGESRTRSEALSLAEKEVEMVRNMIQVGDYTGLADVTTSNIAGTNATFTMFRDIGTELTAPNRTPITVQVSWGAATADEQVIINSEIAFFNPSKSVALSNFGDASAGVNGNAPNPNQNSSASVENQLNLYDGNTISTDFTLESGKTNLYTDADGNLYRDDGNGKTGTRVNYCISLGLTAFDTDLINPLNYDTTTGALKSTGLITLYARRVNLDQISGNESIELYTKNYLSGVADGSCTLEHQYFGGVIVTIKGSVYTAFDLDDIKIDFNKEDMFCAFNPYPNNVSISVGSYACYVGGNCSSSTAGVSNNTDFNTCSNPAAAISIVGAGGFSGNVGLLNVDDDGGGKESICYSEELAGTNTSFSTARKYKTLNTGIEQGINESYDCQDFFIVGRQANESQLSAECSSQMISSGLNLNLPPKEVIRTISGSAANTFVTLLNSTNCSTPTPVSYFVTGEINNATGTVTISTSGGSCSFDTAIDEYSCSGSSTGTDIEIHASTATQTGSCIATISAISPTSSCNITLASPPVYNITGTITGLNGNASVTVTDSLVTVDCTPASATTSYVCSISTNEPSIRIEAVKNSNSNAACSVIGLTGTSGDTITIPNGTCTLVFN